MVCLFKLLPAVYPRRCGEHPIATGTTPATTGLSPQVRGTPAVKTSFQSSLRFIPAGAGNTLVRMAHGPRRSVYPRRCGEHTRSSSAMRSRAGLSPQVRGTRSIHSGNSIPKRFIPAGAGNTGFDKAGRELASVYPRRCGEHSQSSKKMYRSAGLSPQVRGTHGRGFWSVALLRFIPAGAGNTRFSGFGERVTTVYPRRCGEHNGSGRSNSSKSGLSPQVRGTRQHLSRTRRLARFIPAGAGNTS